MHLAANSLLNFSAFCGKIVDIVESAFIFKPFTKRCCHVLAKGNRNHAPQGAGSAAAGAAEMDCGLLHPQRSVLREAAGGSGRHGGEDQVPIGRYVHTVHYKGGHSGQLSHGAVRRGHEKDRAGACFLGYHRQTHHRRLYQKRFEQLGRPGGPHRGGRGCHRRGHFPDFLRLWPLYRRTRAALRPGTHRLYSHPRLFRQYRKAADAS